MAYVEFAKLKETVRIEQVAEMLGLQLKESNGQLRGPCPLHGGGPRTLAITPSKGVWYCFAPECKRGGDSIELVAKVKQCDTQEAARIIASHFNVTTEKKIVEHKNPSKSSSRL